MINFIEEINFKINVNSSIVLDIGISISSLNCLLPILLFSADEQRSNSFGLKYSLAVKYFSSLNIVYGYICDLDLPI